MEMSSRREIIYYGRTCLMRGYVLQEGMLTVKHHEDRNILHVDMSSEILVKCNHIFFAFAH